jgi:hypothetical protein
MVAATVARDSAGGTRCATIPAIAWEALARTRRETAFKPATSTTEYIIVISLQYIRRRVPAGDGRHHDFRHTDIERPHRGGDQRRSAAAADSDHTRDPASRALRAQKIGQRITHRRDGPTAIATSICRVIAGDSGPRDVGLNGWIGPGADVDRFDLYTGRSQTLRDKGQLFTFGIHGRDGIHCA